LIGLDEARAAEKRDAAGRVSARQKEEMVRENEDLKVMVLEGKKLLGAAEVQTLELCRLVFEAQSDIGEWTRIVDFDDDAFRRAEWLVTEESPMER
jgi:hypothetical protein